MFSSFNEDHIVRVPFLLSMNMLSDSFFNEEAVIRRSSEKKLFKKECHCRCFITNLKFFSEQLFFKTSVIGYFNKTGIANSC